MRLHLFTFTLALLLALPAQAQPLADAAAEALAQRFPAVAHKLSVQVSHAPENVLALSDPIVVLSAGAHVPRGRVQVRVQDRRGAAVGPAMLHVAHFDTVVVATATLSAGTALASGDITLAWRETTRLPGAFLRAADLATLPEVLFATRHVRTGAVLRSGDLRGAYAADIGAPVALRYARNGVVFTLRTTAREAGHVGDEIRLYAADTRTTYRARLVAPGEALWTETL